MPRHTPALLLSTMLLLTMACHTPTSAGAAPEGRARADASWTKVWNLLDHTGTLDPTARQDAFEESYRRATALAADLMALQTAQDVRMSPHSVYACKRLTARREGAAPRSCTHIHADDTIHTVEYLSAEDRASLPDAPITNLAIAQPREDAPVIVLFVETGSSAAMHDTGYTDVASVPRTDDEVWALGPHLAEHTSHDLVMVYVAHPRKTWVVKAVWVIDAASATQ